MPSVYELKSGLVVSESSESCVVMLDWGRKIFFDGDIGLLIDFLSALEQPRTLEEIYSLLEGKRPVAEVNRCLRFFSVNRLISTIEISDFSETTNTKISQFFRQFYSEERSKNLANKQFCGKKILLITSEAKLYKEALVQMGLLDVQELSCVAELEALTVNEFSEVLVVADVGFQRQDLARKIDQYVRKNSNVKWIPLHKDAFGVYIGPLMSQGGEGACYDCFLRRLKHNSPGTQFYGSSSSERFLFDGYLASVLSVELIKLLSNAIYSEVLGSCLALDFINHRARPQSVLPFSDCARCGNIHQNPPIQLNFEVT